MIPLPSACLVFKLTGDGTIACTGQPIAFELTGEAAPMVDAELVQNAAAGVLHYFRMEMKRTSVSVGVFSAALETVLHGFGLTHLKTAVAGESGQPCHVESDLCLLTGDGLEMFFFTRLRHELRRQLGPSPSMVRFYGLRPCVMQLAKARRWSRRCQTLHDQIVDYLRSSLRAEPVNTPCGLVIH